MLIPYPDHLPAGLRRLGRRAMGPGTRQRAAAGLQDMAEWQWLLSAQFRANRARLRALRDTKRGRTCVIAGNGPSLAGLDLNRLAGVDTFCLNRGYLLWERAGLTPTYMVAVNDLVLEQFASEIARIDAMTFIPWQHRDLPELAAAVGPAGKERVLLPIRWRPKFHTDISTGLWVGATVTFAAMQIAYHMGYARVVLVGVDHQFTFDGEPNAELTAERADINHFDPGYFGPGTRWHAPDLATSEHAYRLAKAAFEADRRTIVDATEYGALQVFTKMDLGDALS